MVPWVPSAKAKMTLGPPVNLPKITHNRDILCAGPQYLKVIFHLGRFHILHLPGSLSWCPKITYKFLKNINNSFQVWRNMYLTLFVVRNRVFDLENVYFYTIILHLVPRVPSVKPKMTHPPLGYQVLMGSDSWYPLLIQMGWRACEPDLECWIQPATHNLHPRCPCPNFPSHHY